MYNVFTQLSVEDAMKLTKERSESFNKYTTEKGSIFMNDPHYKHYLRLPYLVQSLVKDDQLLEYLLSNEFPVKLMEETLDEVDAVIFYATKVTRNRSLITKAFEYNVRNHPGYNNAIVKNLYARVNENLEHHSYEVGAIEKDIEDLEILNARVKQRYEAARDELIERVNAEENKHLNLKVHKFSVPSVSQVTLNEKYLNWQYLELAERMFDLRHKLQSKVEPVPTERAAELTKEMWKVNWEKIRRAVTKPSEEGNI